LGHNYPIYLLQRGENGRLNIRGGAGGAPSVGGATGLWPPIFFIILPLAGLILYFVGYASLATLSVPLICLAVCAYRAAIGGSPWEYLAYGLFTFVVLVWALKPNIKRLIEGNERLIGYRARHKKNDPNNNQNSGQPG
jgi:glycerol-3-phosphate acyltransferase PlsY